MRDAEPGQTRLEQKQVRAASVLLEPFPDHLNRLLVGWAKSRLRRQPIRWPLVTILPTLSGVGLWRGEPAWASRLLKSHA
jgi:hypothetical protein